MDNGTFKIKETTGPSRRQSELVNVSEVRKAERSIPSSMPTTVADLAGRRQGQMKIICANQGCEVSTNAGELAKILAGLTEFDLNYCLELINGHISAGPDQHAYLYQLSHNKWAWGVDWAVFGPPKSAQQEALTEANLIPVVVQVDSQTGLVKIRVPPGYHIQAGAEAKITGDRLFCQLRLAKDV